MAGPQATSTEPLAAALERLRPTRWLPALVVLLAAVGVYANTLANGWVLDDFPQILQNPWIKGVEHTGEIFSNNAWAFDARDSSYYRPLIQVIYMITYYVFGLRPWGFHLVNVVLHGGVCFLVFLVIRRLLGQPSSVPASVGALLFAVHPIHTEVVAPVMGMHDLSFSLFYLLAFWLYSRQGRGTLWSRAGAVVSFFAALLCKEPAITLPALLVAYDLVVRRERLRGLPAIRRYAPYVAVLGIYFLMRYHALGGVVQNRYAEAEMSAYGYVLNVFPLLVRYLQKLVAPLNLSLVYTYHPVRSLLDVKAASSVAVTAALFGSAWWAARRSRITLFAGILIVLPLLPALYLPGLNQKMAIAFAERYLYLPSVGFAVLVSLLVSCAAARLSNRSAIVVAMATALVVVIFSIGTFARNADWENSYTLWSVEVLRSPESAAVHRDLGYALLYHKKDTEAAKEQFAIARQLDPELSSAAIRAGVAYARQGQTDKAIFQFHAALLLDPDSTDAHYNLGLAYEDKGWSDRAIQEYETALQLQPQNADAHNNLGIAHARAGRLAKALDEFGIAAGLKPTDLEIRANLERASRQLRGESPDAR